MKISKQIGRYIMGVAFGVFLAVFNLPFYTIGYWVIFSLFILTMLNENRND